MDNFISSKMNKYIIIADRYKWHIPYYLPKPTNLSTNAQTFIYTNPYVKIMETPNDIKTNYRRLKETRKSHETFDFSDKENIPPPPPIMLRRSYSSRRLSTMRLW